MSWLLTETGRAAAAAVVLVVVASVETVCTVDVVAAVLVVVGDARVGLAAEVHPVEISAARAIPAAVAFGITS